MPAQPRVLYVGNFLEAANRAYCFDLAQQLETRGMTVLRTSTREARIPRLTDMMRTAWQHRRDYDCAIVDVFSGAAFAWAEATCFVLRRSGKPYILTLHGGNLPQFARSWPRRVRHLLDSAAFVTAPSDYNRSGMSPYRSDIALVRNAVDSTSTAFAVRDRPAPRLIWVRAFHAMYNPTLAIEVLARVARSFPTASLTMIGPDKGDGSLEATRERAEALGVSARIEITGRVSRSEVGKRLTEADIFINTTDVDNTPLSILEALSAGLCVITTSVGGIPYLLENEHTALLVPPADPDAMTAAVERVLREMPLARRLSTQGRSLAMECDWANVVPQWEHMLEQLAHG